MKNLSLAALDIIDPHYDAHSRNRNFEPPRSNTTGFKAEGGQKVHVLHVLHSQAAKGASGAYDVPAARGTNGGTNHRADLWAFFFYRSTSWIGMKRGVLFLAFLSLATDVFTLVLFLGNVLLRDSRGLLSLEFQFRPVASLAVWQYREDTPPR